MRDSLQLVFRNIDEGVLFDEVKAFYPNISALGVAQMEMKSARRVDTIWTAWMQWDTLSASVNKDEATSGIRRYLNRKLNTDTIWLEQTLQQKAGDKK